MIQFCKLAVIAVSITCLSGCGSVTKDIDIVKPIVEEIIEPEETGGHHSNTDRNAPKEIESEDLVSFDGWFASESEDLGYGKFFFKAQTGEDGKVAGSYRYYEQYSDFHIPDFDFEADGSFMNEVNDIIKAGNLASRNGIYEVTDGIPEDFGSYMNAQYGSGEKIYFYDNVSNHYSEEDMTALYNLFYERSGAKDFYDTDRLLNVYYMVYERDVYGFYAYIYENPDGTVEYRVNEKNGTDWVPERKGETSSELLEKISAVYEDNDMGSIQTYPRREGDRYYTLALQFGSEEVYVHSDTNISDDQFASLEGIRDIILENTGG